MDMMMIFYLPNTECGVWARFEKLTFIPVFIYARSENLIIYKDRIVFKVLQGKAANVL
jgi:hypothetical protein